MNCACCGRNLGWLSGKVSYRIGNSSFELCCNCKNSVEDAFEGGSPEQVRKGLDKVTVHFSTMNEGLKKLVNDKLLEVEN